MWTKKLFFWSGKGVKTLKIKSRWEVSILFNDPLFGGVSKQIFWRSMSSFEISQLFSSKMWKEQSSWSNTFISSPKDVHLNRTIAKMVSSTEIPPIFYLRSSIWIFQLIFHFKSKFLSKHLFERFCKIHVIHYLSHIGGRKNSEVCLEIKLMLNISWMVWNNALSYLPREIRRKLENTLDQNDTDSMFIILKWD